MGGLFTQGTLPSLPLWLLRHQMCVIMAVHAEGRASRFPCGETVCERVCMCVRVWEKRKQIV